MASMFQWVDLPEINKKVCVCVSWSTFHSGLGCHASSIANISGGIGPGYRDGISGEWLKPLDPNEPVKYVVGAYGVKIPSGIKEFYTYLHDNKGLKATVNLQSAYKAIVDKTSSYPILVLSDVINYGTKAREGQNVYRVTSPINLAALAQSESSYTSVSISLGSTGTFANWLIKNKQGYVIESPVIQNPNHRSNSNYSLNQLYIWVHPNHLERALNVTADHDRDLLPSEEQWKAKIAQDLSLNSSEVMDTVFNKDYGVYENGKFIRSSEL